MKVFCKPSRLTLNLALIIVPFDSSFDSLQTLHNFKLKDSHRIVWRHLLPLTKHIINIIPLLSTLIKKHSPLSHDADDTEASEPQGCYAESILGVVCCSITAA